MESPVLRVNREAQRLQKRTEECDSQEGGKPREKKGKEGNQRKGNSSRFGTQPVKLESRGKKKSDRKRGKRGKCQRNQGKPDPEEETPCKQKTEESLSKKEGEPQKRLPVQRDELAARQKKSNLEKMDQSTPCTIIRKK